MHFIAGTIEKAGVDECDTCCGFLQTGFQIGRCATLFVHDAQLDGVFVQPQQGFNATKQFHSKGHFFRAVHFGFDDIHRACARVTHGLSGRALEIMQRNGHCDDRIEYAFRDFLAFGSQNRRIRHQVAHITQEEQRAAMQLDRLVIRADVFTVSIERTREILTALGHHFGQCALQNA